MTTAAPASPPAPALQQSQVPPAPGQVTPGSNALPDLSTLSREELEARVKTLLDDVVAANAEAEFFRQQWQDLRLRDEALGVEALTADGSRLEDKVVQSVKELYQSEMKRREALKLLAKLLDTSGQLLATAPNFDPKVRAEYEVAARAAREYLAGHSGASIPLASSLSDAQVSDVNAQLNAVILNVGRSEGVKEGMQFILFHGDTPVGLAKVTLARDLICAANVESLQPNIALRVGDRAQVDTGQ